MPARNPKKDKKQKRQANGDHEVGYCRPPAEHRFKANNPGGPGRPKGRKSQDSLLRAELSKTRVVQVDGRARTVTNLELANKMLVNTSLEGRDPKQLMTLVGEARRLFPEAAPDHEIQEGHDPVADRQILGELLDFMTRGEPDPDCPDPMADLAFGAPDFVSNADADGDDWDEDAWDTAHEETSDVVS